jgi:Wax ester synthase/diacylglycerol acyltransferase catalytic domain/WS/DGAT C-terminal domain
MGEKGAPMIRREKLGPEDMAILRLESPRIAGHTCKVITLDAQSTGAAISIDALRDHIASRLGRVSRMTERLSDDGSHPAWVPDERFDIRHHVVRWPTPAPASRPQLLEIVGRLMETRLDRSRPLWSIHLVDLEADRRALVLLIHHCMADGMTAVRLCSGALWDPLAAAGEREPDAPSQPAAPVAAPVNLRGLVHRELMASADDTPLDRHPSDRRSVATTRASLAELKRIGRTVAPAGATVNDVALCLVAGGLRRWLESHGGPLHRVRIKVPVSLHDHDERSNELGNHDSFLVVDVGVDEPDPAVRLGWIAAQTRERKSRHDAQSLDALFRELRGVSKLAARALSAWSASPRVFTINVSNVPGPRVPIAVMGSAVRDLFTLAEIADRHALRVAVISLADELSFGLCADRAAVENPETIAAGIEADLAALA